MDINIPKNISNLNTLDKVMRTVIYENADAGYNYNSQCYYPILEIGNVIQCQFIGIGSEFNDLHFGVVWSESKSNETLLVIPLTSKSIEKSKAQFSIGKIPNFVTSVKETNVKESFLYVNKITEISRKKIKLWYQKDSHGKPIKDTKNYNVPVKIDQSQIERIKEGIELELLHGDNYLLNILKKVDKSYLPLSSINQDILKLGYRLVTGYSAIKSPEGFILIIHMRGQTHEIKLNTFDEVVFSDKTKYSNDTVKYYGSSIDRRNEILRAIFSENTEQVNKAMEFLPKIKNY